MPSLASLDASLSIILCKCFFSLYYISFRTQLCKQLWKASQNSNTPFLIPLEMNDLPVYLQPVTCQIQSKQCQENKAWSASKVQRESHVRKVPKDRQENCITASNVCPEGCRKHLSVAVTSPEVDTGLQNLMNKSIITAYHFPLFLASTSLSIITAPERS